ncbi:flagellar basal-body rod protein FlgF [Aliidiomarina sedimenti]|uniref:Flagellar basal-body rod protein FlgF n=1 Tax=Aliidiomarina sedimenti TaxID=1933879 RepID=A0ABY0BZ36_9GAMM|nr:flagellar basal-body rod protein FlgF [Aliidiomarina sedimenti]RUO29884.1 flagellar basal-body rod protein FlgF [Aliidiomarina sedimenti]
MDNMLYIAMSGAKEDMNAVAVRANNLANVNTTAFKADLAQARAMQAYGEGHPSRVFSLTERAGQNFAAGALRTTGRDLDVAVVGQGWLHILDENGEEAMTRNGNLEISQGGMLQTSSGEPVMGNAGPIFIPLPITDITIGKDGTISVQPQGAPSQVREEIDRISVVNPPNGNVEKGTDGLFRMKNGEELPLPEFDAQLEVGALEGSNVNAIEEMTQMIALHRNYELSVKMMKAAEENDERQEQLLRIY